MASCAGQALLNGLLVLLRPCRRWPDARIGPAKGAQVYGGSEQPLCSHPCRSPRAGARKGRGAMVMGRGLATPFPPVATLTGCFRPGAQATCPGQGSGRPAAPPLLA